MSTTHEGASEGSPEGDDGGSEGRTNSGGQHNHGDGGGGGGGGGGGHFNSRRKRRRQRPQRTKHRKGGGGGGGQHRSHAVKDDTDRERIFQDIEGLLRRIREEAEEAGRPEEELRDVTTTVTNFTKLLDEEAEVVSERARVEYHRVREKLNHALRN